MKARFVRKNGASHQQPSENLRSEFVPEPPVVHALKSFLSHDSPHRAGRSQKPKDWQAKKKRRRQIAAKSRTINRRKFK